MLLLHGLLHFGSRDALVDLLLPRQLVGTENEERLVGQQHAPGQDRDTGFPRLVVVVVLRIEAVLVDFRPLEVPADPPPGENAVIVECDHASGRRPALAGDVVARPARGVVLAVDPVGPVPPAVVKESGSGKEVRILTRLVGQGALGGLVDVCLVCAIQLPREVELDTLTVHVELLVAHEDLLAVGGEQVGQRHRHVEELVVHLHLIICTRHPVVHGVLGQLAAGCCVQDQEAQATVGIHVASGQRVDLVVHHEHVAVDGVSRLDLLEPHVLGRGGGPLVLPDQAAVIDVEAVDESIGGPAVDALLVDGRRGVDFAARQELPRDLPRCGVDCYEGVAVLLRDENLVLGDHGRRELSTELQGPLLVCRWCNTGESAATLDVSAIGWPFVLLCDRYLCERLLFDGGESLRVGGLPCGGMLVVLGAEHREPIGLGADVAGAGVLR